jgi:transmembrane sensor
MTTHEVPKMTSRDARADAAAWLAKLHGPERSAELEAAFRAWLAAAPEHARAFEHITQVWEGIGNLNTGGLPRLVFHDRLPRHRCSRLAIAALACVVVAALVAYRAHHVRVYVTDIGEQRVVSLEDGSRLALNSRTRVEIEFKGHERLIYLKRGEAFFEVAPDRVRPFSVIVGDRRVTALGTAFLVRCEPDRVAVTLLEGKVAVTPEEAAARVPVAPENGADNLLLPGQRLTVLADHSEKIDAPHIDTQIAWRRGEVVLDETSLSDAVAEMNRYERAELVIDDADIGQLPISGIYKTGDSKGFARTVASVYALAVEERDGRIHLHWRASKGFKLDKRDF